MCRRCSRWGQLGTSIRTGPDEDGESRPPLLSLRLALTPSLCRCRRYVQLLLAVAGLSRVVEWWEAEKGFWNFAQEGNEDIEPLHFVIKDSKVPAATSPLTASSTKVLPSPFSGLGLGFGGKPQFSSIGIRLDAAESPAQLDGERTAVPPKLEIADPTEDLATQVEQAKNVNMVLELSLDGEFVEWINPAWREVVG